jgi:hypothetical protein
MANPGCAHGNPDFIANGCADCHAIEYKSTLAICNGGKASAGRIPSTHAARSKITGFFGV